VLFNNIKTLKFEEIEQLVNTEHATNEIIVSLIPLTIRLTRYIKVKRPMTREDLIGVALLSLVQCVNRFLNIPKEDRQYSIVAYVTSTIMFDLKSNCVETGCVRIPNRTFFRKIKDIELSKVNGTNFVKGYVSYDDQVAIERNEYEIIDIEDFMQNYLSERQTIVVQKMLAGYKLKEIAADFGVKAIELSQIMSTIRSSFRKNYFQ
jgi:hypothetical protein